MGLEHKLIPYRFISTLAHFTVILLIILDEKSSGHVKAAAALSVIFISIEWIGLFSGLTLFHHDNSVFHISSHTIGFCLTSLYIVYEWQDWLLWIFFFVFSVPSGIKELWTIIEILICRSRVY